MNECGDDRNGTSLIESSKNITANNNNNNEDIINDTPKNNIITNNNTANLQNDHTNNATEDILKSSLSSSSNLSCLSDSLQGNALESDDNSLTNSTSLLQTCSQKFLETNRQISYSNHDLSFLNDQTAKITKLTNRRKSSSALNDVNEDGEGIKCDVCSYKQKYSLASSYCSACSINLCNACSDKHDSLSLFRKHSIVPVSGMYHSNILRCDQHANEQVLYYCSKCLVPLCAVCAVTDHVTHDDVVEINCIMGNKKDALEKSLTDLIEKVAKFEELLLKLDDIESLKEVSYKKLKSEIENHSDNLIRRIQERKLELLDQVEQYHMSSLKAMKTDKENLSFSLSNMKSLWKFAAKLMEPGQTVQFLAAYPNLTGMVSRTLSSLEPSLPSEATSMQMFVPCDNMNVGEIEPCEISLDLVRKVSGIQSPLRSSSPCSSDVFSSSFYLEQLDNSLKKLNIRYLKSPQIIWKIDQIGSKIGEINEVYDVAISQEGVVYVAEWLNQRIQIFDAISGCSRDIIGQNQIQPWGITLLAEGNIAVTDEKQRTVKIFDNKGTLCRSWRKQQFGWPRGITCSKNKNIVLTDTQHGRHSVNVLSGDGKLIFQFEGGGTGKLKDQFHWPRYVATDSQNKIIVSDGANHCVKVFDKHGRYLFKFGSQGSSDGLLKHPRGVCVDQADNILVADHDNDRISLFNREGTFVRHVMNAFKPRGVALSERGLLVVSSKTSVVLYKILDFMA